MMEHTDPRGELEASMMENARELIRSLEHREFGDAVQIINELNKVRDRGLYQAVGRLTRKLHTAVVNFHIDPNFPESREMSSSEERRVGCSYNHNLCPKFLITQINEISL